MKRRDFMQTSTLLTAAAAFLPASLLSASAVAANVQKFPAPLKPKMDGDVKEFHLYIDIHVQEIVPGFKIHTLAFNDQVPGPEIRVKRGDKVRVIFKNKTEQPHYSLARSPRTLAYGRRAVRDANAGHAGTGICL